MTEHDDPFGEGGYGDGTPLPQYSHGSEEIVLGNMIALGEKAVTELEGVLAEQDFYLPAHQAVYRAIVAVLNRGGRTDAVSVALHISEHLTQTDELQKIGNATHLHTLLSRAGGGVGAMLYHADIVTKFALKRRMVEASARIADLAQRPVDDVDGMLDQARGLLEDIAKSRESRDGRDGAWISDLVNARLMHYTEPKAPRLATGFHDLDEILEGGLEPGTFTVVGARPGIGKSMIGFQFGLNIAMTFVEAAQDLAKGTVFASAEMSRWELTDRAIAQIGGVRLSHLTRRTLSEDDWNRVYTARHKLQDVPLWVEDRPDITPARLRSMGRTMSRTKAGCGLIVMDYLQLATPDRRMASRLEEVGDISRRMKLLAKELDCAVIGLAQLNRNVESRSSPRPMKSDLREAGNLEQDADNILMLWKDPDEPDSLRITVSKQRQGPEGEVTIAYQPQFARGRSLTRLHVV
ncbi:replicative DNA helicase [Amycolatopsis thailandensis]|uniref:replicative DNA helicase n=1 Tax=Amycolatopsis thailandensis TaxID=589330 RepID=UPI00365DAC9C